MHGRRANEWEPDTATKWRFVHAHHGPSVWLVVFFPLAGLGNVLLHRQGFVPGMARGSGGRHAGDQIWRSIWPSRTLGQVCEAGRVWLSTAPRRTHRITSQRLETPTQTEPDISAAPTRCHVRRGRFETRRTVGQRMGQDEECRIPGLGEQWRTEHAGRTSARQLRISYLASTGGRVQYRTVPHRTCLHYPENGPITAEADSWKEPGGGGASSQSMQPWRSLQEVADYGGKPRSHCTCLLAEYLSEYGVPAVLSTLAGRAVRSFSRFFLAKASQAAACRALLTARPAQTSYLPAPLVAPPRVSPITSPTMAEATGLQYSTYLLGPCYPPCAQWATEAWLDEWKLAGSSQPETHELRRSALLIEQGPAVLDGSADAHRQGTRHRCRLQTWSTPPHATILWACVPLFFVLGPIIPTTTHHHPPTAVMMVSPKPVRVRRPVTSANDVIRARLGCSWHLPQDLTETGMSGRALAAIFG
ncbi:hypothetical protein Purlil1_3955 [Purpureocillium lilacinum]|uniref:Uncharacterized protein n=1 Tax=Purpureocillium lilacinum TaxID=33203 RepID=A0ABR0C5S9_PURLI|nr:hypothetical protein Purlil1_3955 [Purpureocillium lilacinum]